VKIHNEAPQRVETTFKPRRVTSSSNLTNPNMRKHIKLTHQRRTWNNTPMLVEKITKHKKIPPKIITKEPTRKSIRLHSSKIIHRTAPQSMVLNMFLQPASTLFTPTKLEIQQNIPDYEHFCGAGVVHPTTGETITKYRTLAMDPETKEIWTTAFGKELGGLAQGDKKTGEKGSNTIFFMDREQVKNISKDRTITYARICVDYRPTKEDPNRVQITCGGNLIEYSGEVTTQTQHPPG